jgi:hypothetical protein
MFQFPGFASLLPVMTGCNTRRVAPFGHLRITACVPLPGASRSLPRPSSPLCAQASPTCLLSLDYNRSSSNRTTRIVSTSDVFLRKCHLNKGFIIPRSTIHFCCQIAKDPHCSEEHGVQQSRVGGQNVSRRSDYEMLSLSEDSYSRSVKEVIQPQVPLRLPCYDFAPVTALAFGRLVPCGFRHGLRALTASMA